MSMVAGPSPLVDGLLLTCSPGALRRCLGGCLHSGRPLVGDESCWAKMAEAAPLTVGTDVLAGGTVSGGVGDVERSSTEPHALRCQQALESVPGCHKVAAIGPGKRPS